MSARRGEPVFGADDPGSRRLPLAPRSRSVEARAPAPGEVGVEPRVAAEAGEARDATRPTTRSTDAIAGREEAARADTGEATVRTAQSARRGAGKLTLEVGEDEVPQLVRSGKANQVRSSVLATRVLEEAVGALKERGHGDASKQSVQEMLLLALRGVAPDALVALHKQYRTLLQDAREAEAASLLA
jgi:hypothetical protein